MKSISRTLRINKARIVRENETLLAELNELKRQHTLMVGKLIHLKDDIIALKKNNDDLTLALDHIRTLAGILGRIGSSLIFPPPIGDGVGYISRSGTDAELMSGKWCVYEGDATFIVLDNDGHSLKGAIFKTHQGIVIFHCIINIPRHARVFPIVMPCINH